jgi:hypothetical protein
MPILANEQDTLRIIGFTAPKYGGKDTAAKGLLTAGDGYIGADHMLRGRFRRAPMAEGVKNICREVFGWDDSLLEDPVLKETKLDVWPNCEPRWPMMDIANWMRDKYSGYVWPNRWERVALQVNNPFIAHVITDVRFPEELELIQKYNGLLIYVVRDEAEEALKKKQAGGDAMALNPSEAHYDLMRGSATHIVDNNGTIGRLHGEVQAIVRNRFGYWGHWGNESISRR